MKEITREELIRWYIDFFKSKNHIEIPNSSLIPENDPTVLFTTAGMHPLVPFLLGQKHPLGKRLCNVQRCIRTGDIDSVGDSTHHTFFEMLGNWSLGDYFKKESIEYSFEFLTKILKIPIKKIGISVFEGDKNSPKDEEAANIWIKLGIPKERIAFLPRKDNWWGPAGKTGPCGPDTEIFYWKLEEEVPKNFDPKNKGWVEIWNNVLMQYYKNEKGEYLEAKEKNIDTGMGVERTIAILNNLKDNYLGDCFRPIINKIEEVSKKNYIGNERLMRIIADHIKAAVFIISDGVIPSNTEQGYVLRRLIRRSIMSLRKLNVSGEGIIGPIAEVVFILYRDYEDLLLKKEKILEEIKKEEEKFNKTIEQGIKVFEKFVRERKEIDCKNAFLLYQSYGFPLEMTVELSRENGIEVDEKGFLKECKIHEELSRTASAGKFKSGLADNSKETTKLHTAAHLLLQSLKIILKDETIIQKGSNITSERIRFDFSFDRKLTEEEIKKVEDLVNAQIQNSCEVIRQELPLDKARQIGACGIFDKKYSDVVSVYSIGNFSKEICTGPHVKNTCELGRFKIIKEESSGAGVRRIKAILSDNKA